MQKPNILKFLFYFSIGVIGQVVKQSELGSKQTENIDEYLSGKLTDIDFIITTSCTGIMIPSVDAHLINRLKMRQDIVRLPVTEMGCAAGVSWRPGYPRCCSPWI